MFNLGDLTNENNREHNKNWPFIPDHPHRILIIGGPGSGKTNALLNLIKDQDDIDKIYFYPKDLCQPMYEFSIKKCEDAERKYLNDSNACIECSDTIDDAHENIDDQKLTRKQKS